MSRPGPVLTRSSGEAPVSSATEPAVSAPPSRLRAGLAERGIGLEEELGRGGTSIVYRATDRKHARPVVVKVLRPEVSAALGTIRFLREIQFAAVLRHPHILPLYDSGAVDGSLFYVMPYVDGESLRQRLARSGRLPIEEALRIAGEVAGALAHAHAQGIVHRDIKPENILLEAGHAVVADFGVGLAMTRAARDRASAEESGGEPLTAVGTPAYMSPEQASGDAAVDGRSDIYSLGCVVYEMLTGEPPFTGPTTRATIARRFQGPPVPVRQLRPNVPAAVAAAVEQALAFEPSERFATVMDFAQALAAPARRDRLSLGRVARRIAAVTGPLALGAVVLLATQLPHRRIGRTGLNPRRVAVAAPSNETGDSTLAPLGAMVASWITDRLSRSGTVEVVTSATVVPAQRDAHLAGNGLDDPDRLRTLALETRAGTLVSGSYYRGANGVVEFHMEITDANTGRLLRAIGPVVSRGEPARTADGLSRSIAAAIDTLMAQARYVSRPPTPGT